MKLLKSSPKGSHEVPSSKSVPEKRHPQKLLNQREQQVDENSDKFGDDSDKDEEEKNID